MPDDVRAGGNRGFWSAVPQAAAHIDGGDSEREMFYACIESGIGSDLVRGVLRARRCADSIELDRVQK